MADLTAADRAENLMGLIEQAIRDAEAATWKAVAKYLYDEYFDDSDSWSEDNEVFGGAVVLHNYCKAKAREVGNG